MEAKVHTGGEKEFVYTGKEKYGDTYSTTEFKENYKKYISQPKWIRMLKRLFGIFNK